MFVKKIKLTVAIGRNKNESQYVYDCTCIPYMCLSERVRMLKNGEPHNVLRKRFPDIRPSDLRLSANAY